jgi:hypothetical protein
MKGSELGNWSAVVPRCAVVCESSFKISLERRCGFAVQSKKVGSQWGLRDGWFGQWIIGDIDQQGRQVRRMYLTSLLAV